MKLLLSKAANYLAMRFDTEGCIKKNDAELLQRLLGGEGSGCSLLFFNKMTQDEDSMFSILLVLNNWMG
ncbi:hypothetical protein TVAGG3_0802620 [Trichomonas vaginalis G3]|uniref:hypothetical protein n=1 Tax=Trichomonas vaginalis (strain ATCC PRA-98 / G3) TaxID=412133 RepID=UPI0021E5E2F2|nr:hypothetical protein TVAGG3_0802620 [Trichomonas vaginalis G3]KAI5496615.1 hypothetical protein TVAGG3_0802620 [Trichomonas vaginalis G3]